MRTRFITLFSIVLLCALLFSCGGIPGSVNAAKQRIRDAGFPNEITCETYASGSRADGKIAVLLYADASSEQFLQAVLYGTEQQAEDALQTLREDELLQTELEEGNRSLRRAGNWVLIGPEAALHAFAGEPVENNTEGSTSADS